MKAFLNRPIVSATLFLVSLAPILATAETIRFDQLDVSQTQQ
jgi:hypothetical protein